MILLYLDSSALVKRYVSEPGSAEVLRKIGEASASPPSISNSGQLRDKQGSLLFLKTCRP
jgi:hypothetical protein